MGQRDLLRRDLLRKIITSPPGKVSGLGYTGGADGTAAAASTAVVSTGSPGTVNYALGAAGTLGPSASINTLRWAGGPGTLATDTTFTTKGILNAGSGLLTFSGAVTAGANNLEMVVNTAIAGITFGGIFTGTINKTGSGTMSLSSVAMNTTNILNITVNEGVLVTNTNTADGLPVATINSGGALRWGGGSDFGNGAVFTVNAGGTFDANGQGDLIGGLSGAGSVTSTGGLLQLGSAGTLTSL